MGAVSFIPFTSEVFARRFLDRDHDVSLVAWSESMVLAGFESKHLYMLLGEAAPFNKFAMDDMLDRIRYELDLPKIGSPVEAVEILATAHIQRFVRGWIDSRSAMSDLASLYLEEEVADSILDFYLLHWSYRDLSDGDYSYHFPDVDHGNIDQVVQDRCEQWCSEHPLAAWTPHEWYADGMSNKLD